APKRRAEGGSKGVQKASPRAKWGGSSGRRLGDSACHGVRRRWRPARETFRIGCRTKTPGHRVAHLHERGDGSLLIGRDRLNEISDHIGPALTDYLLLKIAEKPSLRTRRYPDLISCRLHGLNPLSDGDMAHAPSLRSPETPLPECLNLSFVQPERTPSLISPHDQRLFEKADDRTVKRGVPHEAREKSVCHAHLGHARGNAHHMGARLFLIYSDNPGKELKWYKFQYRPTSCVVNEDFTAGPHRFAKSLKFL